MNPSQIARAASVVLALAALAGAAGCDRREGAERRGEASGSDVPLIPRHVLFGEPDRVRPQISPDGRRLAFLARHEGALNVWVGPVSDPEAARPVTRDAEPIHRYWWAETSEHVLYLQDRQGDENDHLFAVSLATGEIRDLTPYPGVRAQVREISHRHPGEVLVQLNDRDPALHDLWRIDIRSGERRLVARNEGFAGWAVDDDFRVRLASRFLEDGSVELQRPTAEGWEPWTTVPAADNLTTGPIGFTSEGRLIMQESRGRNTAAVVQVDLETGETRILSEDPRADAGTILRQPTEGRVQAVAYTYARREWDVLDPSLAPDFEALAGLADAEVEVMSRTRDDRVWIVGLVRSDGPVEYYLSDRRTRRARFLFVNREELRDYRLAPMRAEVVRARDGLPLVSYLTLPAGSDPDGDGRPARPAPMLLLVHGGPWYRDRWGFDPLHQLAANRGYAALSVNYRGSTGFGKRFVNAGDREWGRRMHEDLLDGVRWAVSGGIADSTRVAIVGGSYGGYAALAGLTFTPREFAAAVDIVGPSNLLTLLESLPPYWGPVRSVFHTRVGDPTTEEGRRLLLERSPLTHVDSIRRPLLIAQGANDPRVKREESDRIAYAMTERGIPVTYLLFPDEGHGFSRHENNLAFWAVAEAFLARHLGGRSQPLSREDFAGSSLQVLEGAGEVPGLADALPGATSDPTRPGEPATPEAAPEPSGEGTEERTSR